jgi:hypothetical protein
MIGLNGPPCKPKMARPRQGGCISFFLVSFFWLQFPALNPNLNRNPNPGCTKKIRIRIRIKIKTENSLGGPEKLGQKKEVAIIAVWPRFPLFEGLTERAGVDSMAQRNGPPKIRSSNESDFSGQFRQGLRRFALQFIL